MTQEITLEKALGLVEFQFVPWMGWRVASVKESVFGDVYGDVKGFVHGNINNRPWKYIETPMQRLDRLIWEKGHEKMIQCFNVQRLEHLIRETGDEELIECFNQLENNDD